MNIRLVTIVVLTCAALVGGCSSIELPDDRASLLKLGDSTDLETSVRASQKLAELYGEPALIEALKTSGPTGRSWAAALLLGYPSSAARDALFAAAKDPSPDVRVQVAIALGGICNAQCLPTLEALSGLTCLPTLESTRVDIIATAEQRSEEPYLGLGRRRPVHEVRDHFR